MNASSIADCGVRAIYAYESATVLLDKCTIRGTKSPHHGAVELRGVQASRHMKGTNTATDIAPHASASNKNTEISIDKLQRKGKHVSALERGDAVTITTFVGKYVLFDSNAGPSIKLSGPVSMHMTNSIVYDQFKDSYVAFNDRYPLPRLHRYLKHRFHCTHASDVGKRCTEDDFENNPKLVWYYERNDDDWIQYSPSVSLWLSTNYFEMKKALESSSQSQNENTTQVWMALPPPLNSYEVDFQKMTQRNKSTFFERAIRYYIDSASS
jgi:hypothetical protein